MRKLAAVLACVLFAHGPAAAFGDKGHQAIGALAARLIAGSPAEREVRALLKDGETLASASQWLDDVKGNFGFQPDAEMRAFVAAHARHSTFHYTELPLQAASYDDSPCCRRADDAVQLLEHAIAVLQGRAEAAHPVPLSRREALLLLIHLAGDLHQPLHVGNLYLDAQDQPALPGEQAVGTLGGSSLQFSGPDYQYLPPNADQPVFYNLHAFWDLRAVRLALDGHQGDFAQAAAPAGGVGLTSGPVQAWPRLWAKESLALARTVTAPIRIEARSEKRNAKGEKSFSWNISVPADYPQRAAAIAELQMVRAGYRLAALLQAIWP